LIGFDTIPERNRQTDGHVSMAITALVHSIERTKIDPCGIGGSNRSTRLRHTAVWNSV